MTTGLLLIHAFPLDARMWHGQIERFGGTTTVLAPDLPGFGGSPGAGEVMTMASAAERCLQTMDVAGLDSAVACGLSIGGYVAFELWRRARGRIAGLVLANTRATADPPEAANGRRALATRLLAEGNGFLVESPPALLSEGAPETLQELVRGLIADQPAASIAAASLGMAERPDSTPDLATIDVPTIVVTSTGDRLIPPEASSLMAAQIPEADLEVIEDAGHLSNLEAPEPFDLVLQRMLDSVGVGLDDGSF